MFAITIDNKKFSFTKKIKVLDLIDKKDYSIIACTVNNRVRELSFEIFYDAEVKFLRLDNHEATRIYNASLRYLFAMAVARLYPELDIRFSYHISRSIFCKIINDKRIFTPNMLKEIEKEMKRIIDEDLPITRKVVSNEDAAKIYEKYHLTDKINILKYRSEKTVHLYQCEEYLNYVYSYMVPSTGYLKNFKLTLYSPGILLQYPRSEFKGEIPGFVDEPTYGETLKRANLWAKIVKAEDIAEINEHIDNGPSSMIDFVNVCEARHNDRLSLLAQRIEQNIDNVKIIAIAGPSSSGKTTFSNRLRIQLMSRGITPVKLSIDDYYLDRDKIQPDENGKIDLEHINTIDVELFNQHLFALINGEEVDVPHFDFTTGKRKPGKKMKIGPHSPIIIEGIHALNEALSPSIPRHQKFKIYIAPHVQVNIDNHSPISSTQIRLIRRIVRDHKFRAFSAERTLEMWDSVRNGEFRWIYENQEGVDFVFNSDLVYELCVLKKHALPLLRKIPDSSPHYIAANSLIKFIKYYRDIDDKLVPCNSLLREFIGDSCFQDV